MRTHLIQSHEPFGPPDRQAELRDCWRRNEGLFDLYTHPLGRPTFAELFAMCRADHINVIANADIYFEAHEVDLIRYAFTMPGVDDTVRPTRCLALSRWETIDGNGTQPVLWDHADSQDTWCVYGGPHTVDALFSQGVPGCDNALAYSLQQAGFALLNPSRTIRTFHLHNVDHRSYLADASGVGRGGVKLYRVPPPYVLVKPTEL